MIILKLSFIKRTYWAVVHINLLFIFFIIVCETKLFYDSDFAQKLSDNECKSTIVGASSPDHPPLPQKRGYCPSMSTGFTVDCGGISPCIAPCVAYRTKVTSCHSPIPGQNLVIEYSKTDWTYTGDCPAGVDANDPPTEGDIYDTPLFPSGTTSKEYTTPEGECRRLTLEYIVLDIGQDGCNRNPHFYAFCLKIGCGTCDDDDKDCSPKTYPIYSAFLDDNPPRPSVTAMCEGVIIKEDPLELEMCKEKNCK